jgi:farnesyl-diphosphate farnesyltransferase
MRDAGDLFGPDAAALRAGVLERLVEKARGHLDDAMTYLTSIRRRHADIRLFCALPLFYAERTVALSRSAGEAVFMREVKMTRRDVGRIGVLTGVAVRSNLALRQIARRLRR